MLRPPDTQEYGSILTTESNCVFSMALTSRAKSKCVYKLCCYKSTDRLFLNIPNIQMQKTIIEKTLHFYLTLLVQVHKVLGAIQVKEMIS